MTICICGHVEEDHGPSGACAVDGCLCACFETEERTIEAITLTTAHSLSSYGRPVLVVDGEAYGPADLVGDKVAADLVHGWAARFCGEHGMTGLETRLGNLTAALQAVYVMTTDANMTAGRIGAFVARVLGGGTMGP